MKDKKPSFDEFITLARHAARDDEVAAAPSFITRVAARWANALLTTNWLALWERAVWWGAAGALAVCLLAAWFCRADFNASTRAADSFAAFTGLDEDNGQ
jgi:hypothetical protein